MAGRQQFKTSDEGEATVKRAVELYHRDRATQESVVAAQGALNEMEIPAEYLDAAQKELEQEKNERKARQQAAYDEALRSSLPSAPKTVSEAIARLIHDWGFIYGPVIMIVLLYGAIDVFGAMFHHGSSNSGSNESSKSDSQQEVHDGTPTKWDFSSNRSDFLFSTNPETDADMAKVREGGRTFERIHIRSFGKDPKLSNDAKPTAFFTKAYLNDQTVYFHGLGHIKFKARSKGISKLHLGFTDVDGTDNRFSDDITLTSQWKEYTVDLNKLSWTNESGEWRTDGKAPSEGGFYFFTGDGSNELKETGNVDFTDIELTN